jgi:type IV pilus assembly protein PilV
VSNDARGFALMESLIALLILSLGALGLLRMATAALAAARDTDHYVTASIRATELMDTIRVVPNLTDSYWLLSKSTASTTLTAGEKKTWLASVESTLPHGTASVSCTSGLCTLTLYWKPLAQADELSATYTVGKP